jgi:hypothetical protein
VVVVAEVVLVARLRVLLEHLDKVMLAAIPPARQETTLVVEEVVRGLLE